MATGSSAQSIADPEFLGEGPIALWHKLSVGVKRYAPSVVVLVARKAPRIVEALGLDLNDAALVISDLAIPFCRESLRGARVAIIDDVVNVGSTLKRAADLIRACGVQDLRVFALTHKGTPQLLDNVDVEYACETALDERALRAFARVVPEIIQKLPKPYDLDFPIIETVLVPPYRSFDDLKAAMGQRFGGERVYDMSTPGGMLSGTYRLVVERPPTEAAHSKIRLYFDGDRNICRVVPISISSPLAKEPPAATEGLSTEIWNLLSGQVRAEDTQEPLARLRLFIDALRLGSRFLSEVEDVLSLSSSSFQFDDARLIFGPRIKRLASAAKTADNCVVDYAANTSSDCSPFWRECVRQGFPAAVSDSKTSDDIVSIMTACFNVLSLHTGADNVSNYRMVWPYGSAEIDADPYLRLRIGPTFLDLVQLVQHVSGREACRREVSRLLDRFIDMGAVVPTIARYGNEYYRIYRKGEADPRDPISERTLYAWQRSGKALSLTRLAKIITVLAFSEKQDPGVVVKAEQRGNVACYAPSIVDSETEIGHFLLRTDQLRKI